MTGAERRARYRARKRRVRAALPWLALPAPSGYPRRLADRWPTWIGMAARTGTVIRELRNVERDEVLRCRRHRDARRAPVDG